MRMTDLDGQNVGERRKSRHGGLGGLGLRGVLAPLDITSPPFPFLNLVVLLAHKESLHFAFVPIL